MDTWAGNNHDPITLHKYLYANANPVMFTDPTGNFGLASMSAANSIASVLHDIQINIGTSILDSAFNPDSASSSVMMGGIAAIGGGAGFKLLRMLSGKFRKMCNSFDGDTLVSTEFGLRPIRDINIGDKVWAYNEETGEKSLQEVVHLIQTEGTKELVDIQVMGGEVITATAEHPFYLANTNEWAYAKNLTLESSLQNIDGEWIGIEGVAQYEEIHKVYNLTVNNDHTYFVGEGQVLSHNASSCDFTVLLNQKLKNKLKRINNQVASGGMKSISGALSKDDVVKLGMAFVGKDYVVGKGRKGVTQFTSLDGKRKFTYPTEKVGVNPVDGLPWSKTGLVSNFETRLINSGKWINNVHVDVMK